MHEFRDASFIIATYIYLLFVESQSSVWTRCLVIVRWRYGTLSPRFNCFRVVAFVQL